MPRRPNTKNIPSRLFEESATPIFIINEKLVISYANAAFAALVGYDRDVIVDRQLIYRTEFEIEVDQALAAFCPSPTFVASAESSSTSGCDFKGEKYSIFLSRLVLPNQEVFVVGKVSAATPDLTCSSATISEQLHSAIQSFRAKQTKRFRRIPFLGQSAVAQKCFDQARAYAISNSNVSLVGHPRSQIVEVAKAIHYSGFSSAEDSDVLLPIDCECVESSRIQTIIVDHLQVMAAGDSGVNAFVLLINAECLSEMAQRDLLSLQQLPDVEIRWMSTSGIPLMDVDGFDSNLAAILSTLEMKLPRLCERKEDVLALAQQILESSNEANRQIAAFHRDAIEALELYSWPGDYQEVVEVCEAGKTNCTSDELRLEDFPLNFRMAVKAIANPRKEFDAIKMDEVLSEFESEMIARAIAVCNGNKTNAARLLGITRARLHRKLDENGEPND
jgi:transcriptional regulator with PAS, ATPase and Fis domain